MSGKVPGLIVACLLIVAATSPAGAQDGERRAMIEGAKKEGEVVWYTSAGLQDSNPMAEAFRFVPGQEF